MPRAAIRRSDGSRPQVLRPPRSSTDRTWSTSIGGPITTRRFPDCASTTRRSLPATSTRAPPPSRSATSADNRSASIRPSLVRARSSRAVMASCRSVSKTRRCASRTISRASRRASRSCSDAIRSAAVFSLHPGLRHKAIALRFAPSRAPRGRPPWRRLPVVPRAVAPFRRAPRTWDAGRTSCRRTARSPAQLETPECTSSVSHSPRSWRHDRHQHPFRGGGPGGQGSCGV